MVQRVLVRAVCAPLPAAKADHALAHVARRNDDARNGLALLTERAVADDAENGVILRADRDDAPGGHRTRELRTVLDGCLGATLSTSWRRQTEGRQQSADGQYERDEWLSVQSSVLPSGSPITTFAHNGSERQAGAWARATHLIRPRAEQIRLGAPGWICRANFAAVPVIRRCAYRRARKRLGSFLATPAVRQWRRIQAQAIEAAVEIGGA